MNTPLATGRLDGRTWRATKITIDAFTQPAVEFVFTDAPRMIYIASPSASGPARQVWKQARQLPAVAAAMGQARAEHEHRLQEQRRRAREYQARQAAQIEQAAAEDERVRTEAEQRGRRCYLRFGRMPESGASYNHRDGRHEAGVGAYSAWCLPGEEYVIDLRGVDVISALFITAADTGQPVYEVTGTVLESTGSDGEPLLAAARDQRVHPESIQTIL